VIISITGGEDMRLMEVDEAANHIKELVDPDANIIWGSAFNNDLDGKIRVSVVATGIDAQDNAMTPAAPAKVFAFPGRAAAEPAPRAAAQPQMVAPARAPEPQPVAQAAAEPEGDDPALGLPTEEEASDELLLGEVDMLEDGGAGEAPMEGENRSWTDQEEEEAPRAAPAREGGGTLFERMSNIARGAAKAQVDDDTQTPRLRRERDPLDIPRFLNRQNNQ
jgi:cell division protein FtsZ